MMPATRPEKKPTRTPGVENWLQWLIGKGLWFPGALVASTSEPVGAELDAEVFDVGIADDLGDVAVGLDVGEAETPEVDVLWGESVHWLSPEQLIPDGQHRFPHCCRFAVRSVVNS